MSEPKKLAYAGQAKGQALLIVNGVLQPAPESPRRRRRRIIIARLRRLTWVQLLLGLAGVVILGVWLGLSFVLFLIDQNREPAHAEARPTITPQHSRGCAPIPRGGAGDPRDLGRRHL